ncbi:MAG: TlpA family protein disulfide reductase [Myxococcales bacterium]|nr:TlpA family protein disulfide reductase [Myxococcales bacterium]MCB9546471.1 TlpA family protein disulfide reductase [Myxococcales bacterium]
MRLALCLLAALLPHVAAAQTERPQMGDFGLSDLEGRTVRLSDFRGKVVVVNFWATWCEPCKQELPFLDAYYRELAARGLVVLAISTDGPRTVPAVRQIVKQRGWTLPILLDQDGAVMADLNPRGAAPYTLYVDRLGRIAADHDGYAPGDEVGMKAQIEALLAEGEAPAPAEGQAGSVRVINSLTVQSRTVDVPGSALDPPVDGEQARTYQAILDRLNIQGSAGGLTTFARVDAMQFFDAPKLQPEQPHFADDARLERLRVRYTLGAWDLTAGDFFEQLGRGIVLSIRKVDELGVDLEIRGGRLAYDGEAVAASVFAGRVNPANLDIVSERFVEDTDDVMAGGRVAVKAIPGVEVGVFALHLRPETQALGAAAREVLGVTDDDQSTGGGLYVEAPEIGGLVTLYAEADLQQKTIAGEDADGRAVYGTANLALPHVNVLVEGMYLDEYEVRGSPNSALQQAFSYNQVPTLERLDQIVDNVIDFTGGRLYVEPYFLDGTLIFHANGMLRQNDPGEDAEIRQVHGYGGVKLLYQDGRSRVELSGGHRDERKVVSGDRFRSVSHVELDWLQALGGSPYALHLQSRNDFRSQETPDPANPFLDFVWSSTLLSIDHAGLGSLAVELGVDTQDQSDGAQQLFVAGILDLHVDEVFDLLGVDGLEPILLRTTVGSQRGGIKCIAGICRDFPEFSGVKVNLVTRHTLGG